jgi:hypothetical protein
MNRFTRVIAPVAAAATLGSMLAAGAAFAAFAPTAFADGKATMGCSQPYQLASIADIDAFSQPLVQEGFFTEDSLLALLNTLDHNGDGYLCFKVPPGWTGPPATSGAQRAGFVNLVDDKVISS